MLEATSFPSDNKIVSQVVRNIMGLRSTAEEVFLIKENLLL